MSKYLVLYTDYQTIRVYEAARDVGYYRKSAGEVEHMIDTLSMKVFDNQQEAADFAIKNDGFVVIPAQITSAIKEVK